MADTYRPICLINTLDKIVEEMICQRINLEIESKGGLSPRQFGFRKGKSTVDTMKEVIACMERGTRKRNSRGFRILITLDIRNVFNSASCLKIIEGMERMEISKYLVETAMSFLTDSTVLIGQESSLEMTCVVPHGSNMGPLFWYIM